MHPMGVFLKPDEAPVCQKKLNIHVGTPNFVILSQELSCHAPMQITPHADQTPRRSNTSQTSLVVSLSLVSLSL